MRNQKYILLIEDEPGIADALKQTLEDEGFQVFHASNGRDALLWLRHIEPVVIITDMMMPVMDGMAFLKELGDRYSERRPPVLAMSGLRPYLASAMALGATATMEKPFQLDQFVATVVAMAEGRHTSAQRPPMKAAETEMRRLQEIIELKLDQPDVGALLDDFVEFVARLFEVPISIVSIITDAKQIWAASCGLNAELKAKREGPRSESFCTHAVVAHSALVVQDAAENYFFRDNPFVRQRGFRFYAGVPVFSRHGEPVGTLCLLDRQARTFTKVDLEMLSVLSKRILTELDWREKRANPESPDSTFRYLKYYDEEIGIAGREAMTDFLSIEAWYFGLRQRPLSLVVLPSKSDELPELVKRLRREFSLVWVGRLDSGLIALTLPDLKPEAAMQAVSWVAGTSASPVAAEVAGRPLGAVAELHRLEALVRGRAPG